MTAKGAVFERGRLTDWLLSQFATALQQDSGILVGDQLAPLAGGWTKALPGDGEFVPYMVLTTNTASKGSAPTLASKDQDEWIPRYKMASYGGTRQQTDYVADQARKAWYGIGRQDIPLGDERWRVYQFAIVQMGAIVRNDQVSPPAWELVDDVSLNVTR